MTRSRNYNHRSVPTAGGQGLRGPLSRPCPRCGSPAGGACMKVAGETAGAARIKSFHVERRNPNGKAALTAAGLDREPADGSTANELAGRPARHGGSFIAAVPRNPRAVTG